MQKPTDVLETALVPFLFTLCLPIISIMVFINPSGFPVAALRWYEALPCLLLYQVFLFAIFLRISTSASRREFAVLTALFLLGFGVVFFLGVRVHRDFHSSYFMQMLAYYILLIRNKRLLANLVKHRNSHRVISAFSVAYLLIVYSWIILMGYAIVTRKEPRFCESIVYNSYNGVLALFLFFSASGFSMKSKRSFHVSKDRVLLEFLDLTPLFNERERAVLFALVSSGRTTCYAINAAQNSDCAGCNDLAKASLCIRYRKTQEAIASLSKLLEVFAIGTMLGPANKRQVLSAGWSMTPAWDVRIVAETDGVEG